MKSFTLKAAALAVAGATLAASASPAEARRHWNGDRYYHRDRTGTAIAAGVVGLAIGAALASSSRDRYYDGYYYDRYPRYRDRYYYNYDRPYYYDYDRYYYDRPYRYRGYYPRCKTRKVYDPYIGRRVRVRYCR